MIKELTSLRGIFILFIFFHHCLDIYPGGGSMAVAFFFVLGGFSMTLGYHERVTRPDFSYKQFITRRCIKFYPLHWICLLAAIPLSTFVCDWKHLAVLFSNAALMQTLIPLKPLFFSYNAVSWYLADTLVFAIVFPPLAKWIIKSSTKVRVAIAALFVCIYIAVLAMIPKEMYHPILYISPYMRLMDFVFGIFLALSYLNLGQRFEKLSWCYNKTVLSIIVIALIAFLVTEPFLLDRFIWSVAPVYWLPIAALILTAFSFNLTGGGYNILSNKYIQRLGELSFTIFLTHQLVLRYLTILFHKLHFENDAIYVVFALVITVFLSVFLEKYILKPITRWLTKKILPSTTVR